MNLADKKQAIGRAARMCGQKGLKFNRAPKKGEKRGWTLNVYLYQDDPTKGELSVKKLVMKADPDTYKYADLVNRFTNMSKQVAIDNKLNQQLNRTEKSAKVKTKFIEKQKKRLRKIN